MTPFQQLRLWARRAGIGERLAAGTAAAVVLVAAVVVLVPGESRTSQDGVAEGIAGDQTGSIAGAQPDSIAGAQPDVVGTTGADGASVSVGGANAGPGSAAAGATAGRSAGNATGKGCVSPPGSDQGVTPTTIKIASSFLSIPAQDSAFGIPTAEEQQKYSEAVVDEINASGGVACRKLVVKYYHVNPFDQNAQRAACSDIKAEKVFSVLDVAAVDAITESCFGPSQIPIWGNSVFERIKDKYYPYIFGASLKDDAARNAVFGLKQIGFFSPANGFKKLGWYYRDCDPSYIKKYQGWLNRAGLWSAQTSYNMGCPAAETPPTTIQAAVLKFKQEGVTHVTFVHGDDDFASFTAIAEQQEFRPKYGVPDLGIVGTSAGARFSRSWDNMDNTIAITNWAWGEPDTPGIKPSAGTAKCDAIYKARGYPPTYKQGAGIGGFICSDLWWFQAAAEHAPVLQRNALAAGLSASGQVLTAYGMGPNNFGADFAGPRVTTGGQYWRVIQFDKGCTCWPVIDRTWHPRFQFQ